MNFVTGPILYGLGAVAVAAGLFAGVQTVRLANEKSNHAQTKLDHAAVLKNLADLTAKAREAIRARERQFSVDESALRDTLTKDKDHALAKKDAVIAELGRKSLRLQDHWACPVPGTGSAATAADLAGSAGAADLRATGAGSLVQIGADADAEVRYWQGMTLATRKACGVTP